jgi:hypothetical protein
MLDGLFSISILHTQRDGYPQLSYKAHKVPQYAICGLSGTIKYFHINS